MQIDWITVSAQIINFLILVWLLKRFLYQPVIDAMEKREQRITDKLLQAEQREQQALAQINQYQDKTDALDERREQLLEQAAGQADEQKKSMLAQAREEVEDKRQQWQRQAQQEKHDFLHKLRLQTADTVQVIARHALRDLANQSLEQQVVDTFVDRLTSLGDDQRKTLRTASGPVLVHSAFALDGSLQDKLTHAIHGQIAGDIDVDYARAPDLLCGIELRRGEQRLGWNLADYMDDLHARVDGALSPDATAQRAQA